MTNEWDVNVRNPNSPAVRAERRVMAWLETVFPHGTVLRFGKSELHIDVPQHTRQQPEWLNDLDRPDLAVAAGGHWDATRPLSELTWLVEVKAAKLHPYHGWIITDAAFRRAKRWESKLEDSYAEHVGEPVDVPIIDGWDDGIIDLAVSDVAPRFYFALVSQHDTDPLVTFVTLDEAKAIRHRVYHRMGDRTPGLKWLLPAAQLATPRWFDMSVPHLTQPRLPRPLEVARWAGGHYAGPIEMVDAEDIEPALFDNAEEQPSTGYGSEHNHTTSDQAELIDRLAAGRRVPSSRTSRGASDIIRRIDRR